MKPARPSLRGRGPLWSEGARRFAVMLGQPGVYRKQVACELRCTVSMVSMLATGERRPTLDLAARIQSRWRAIPMIAWTQRAKAVSQDVKTEDERLGDVEPTMRSESRAAE